MKHPGHTYGGFILAISERGMTNSLVRTLSLNNIVLGKLLVSLKILLLSGGMNWLPLGYNHIHGMGLK
jgi:hypothetical protein